MAPRRRPSSPPSSAPSLLLTPLASSLSTPFSARPVKAQTMSLLLLLVLFSFLSLSSLPLASAAPSTIPRKSHTATYSNHTVYFVGGQGTAAANDNTPLKSISALTLLDTLDFKETSTSVGIYNHAAMSYINPQAGSSLIGITFGQSAANVAGDPMQWLNPITGQLDSKNTPALSAPNRIGHTLVQYKTKLYLFGGRTLGRGTPRSPINPVRDTLIFDLVEKRWESIEQTLDRSGHASTSAGTDNLVSCFGVSTTGSAYTSDCVTFSITNRQYSPVKLRWDRDEDAISGPRIGHTLVTSATDSNILYLFGGMNSNGTEYYSDMYRLDAKGLPDVMVVTKMHGWEGVPAHLIPGPRAEHAAVMVGSKNRFMIIQGGITANKNFTTGIITNVTQNVAMMADATPYYFNMANPSWISGDTFLSLYKEDMDAKPDEYLSEAVILAFIVAGVSVLGMGVAYYIRKGLRDDARRKQEEEAAAESARNSRTSSYMESDFYARKKGGNGGGGGGGMGYRKERKGNSVYPLGSSQSEDNSMAMEPFKSTSSLIQSEETSTGKKSNKKKQHQVDATAAAAATKPWATGEGAYSPGASTLTENESMHGYTGGPASPASKLHKNNSIGASSHQSSQPGSGKHGHQNSSGSAAGAGAAAAGAAAAGGQLAMVGADGVIRDSYYKDLDEQEDDDSSITVSLASESTMSPWAGPRRMSLDLAPPNPRFSRGVMSPAHRQLMESITTQGHHAGGNATTGHQANGWDTDSPGGSEYSRDDNDYRRSVNSIQWVSFDPLDLATRPDSFYDPLSQPRSLTVRNASMYSNHRLSNLNQFASGYTHSNGSNPRTSISNVSETATSEDSGSNYSGPGGRRISAALAARQQRRSMRNSQDSQYSYSGGKMAHFVDGPLHLSSTAEEENGTWETENGGHGEQQQQIVTTELLPVVMTKITKPSVAKVMNNQRGARSADSLPEEEEEEVSGSHSQHDRSSGLGIDFAGFNVNNYGPKGSSPAMRSNFYHSAAYQTRRQSSTLNPSHNRAATSKEIKLPGDHGTTHVAAALGMPPTEEGDGDDDDDDHAAYGYNNSMTTHNNQMNSSRLRTSIMKLGEDMPGFLDYGDNNNNNNNNNH
ncbi:MAG: hypothetical protein J3Q66DRAFT_438333 [Benniella sp.]|nr:MAG: hypothetical protein J3Q66DRAFT_438333 [Benniella sp.]